LNKIRSGRYLIEKITPQAQLIYSAANADFTDNFGAYVSLNHSDRLTGHPGAAFAANIAIAVPSIRLGNSSTPLRVVV